MLFAVATLLGIAALSPLSPQSPWEPLAAVEGSLLFTCATEPATAEVYFKDDAGAVHQLTVTEPKAGANDAVWQGKRIVAVIDRNFTNQLEVRELDTPPTTVGKRLGGGVSPAVSPTGTLAYVRSFGVRVGDVVLRRGRNKRVLHPREAIWSLFWVGKRRLFAHSESRSGRQSLVEITRRPARVIPLTGDRVGRVAISKQRRVAYSFRRSGRWRLAVMRLDGSHRRVFRRDWAPLAWSPDGTHILVAATSNRVGLMRARTGKVRSLGRLPCGFVTSAEWTPPGEHPWPAP
jgi:hypothetical protein